MEVLCRAWAEEKRRPFAHSTEVKTGVKEERTKVEQYLFLIYLQLGRIPVDLKDVCADVHADGADEVVGGALVEQSLKEAGLANAGVANHDLKSENGNQ